MSQIVHCDWLLKWARWSLMITHSVLQENSVLFPYNKSFIDQALLIYTAQSSPFRCKKLPAINGSPEQNYVQKLHYTDNHYTNTDS